MKRILSHIIFESDLYDIYHEEKLYPETSDMIIRITCMDEKVIKIMFKNTIRFDFSRAGFIKKVYQIENSDFLNEALETHFVKVPLNHDFKNFRVSGITDYPILNIIAQNCFIIN